MRAIVGNVEDIIFDEGLVWDRGAEQTERLFGHVGVSEVYQVC